MYIRTYCHTYCTYIHTLHTYVHTYIYIYVHTDSQRIRLHERSYQNLLQEDIYIAATPGRVSTEQRTLKK